MRAMWMVALFAGVASPAMAKVDYAIDLTKPEHHSGKVTITFPAAAGDTLDVKMPAWRTGRYSILNLANGVSGFTATDASGRKLGWQKVDKSTWRIRRASGQPVTVTYDVFGNELGLRSRHIDDSHAYLDASGVFMYADRHRQEPVSVALSMPGSWRAFSGMEPNGRGRFTAPNWDVLVDSPIEAGPHQLRTFDADGRRYELVIWGKGNHDGDRMVADLKKMVPQSQTIWKGYPFRRYLFIVHATDGVGGATEHKNSTVIQLPRYRFAPRDRYMGFLGTASHEFIHTWNVKAYRAGAMVPYDYEKENYTDLLWVHEGSTEYFTPHLLLRSGLMKPDEYFGELADAIDANKNRPGRLVKSVAEASFDEWMSPSGNRANNAWVNIYSEGAIASWALDIALLQDTGGRVSYRDVHQRLYERFGNGARGFTSADMRAILAELTGHSWDAWWAKYVDAPSDVDFAALLAPVGLTLDMGGAPTVAKAGWSADASGGAMKLTAVTRDGPAWNAGLETDDILVAIDGKRVDEGRFATILGDYKPGDTVTVSFFRRDELQERKLVLGGRPAKSPSVRLADNPTAQQKALFQRWLLVPYPAK
ncbi:M61 family metallopeptidase [Sphingomonas rhizophila]|uniref:M61 family metallopeptidase n=1 Tax=Sphingomonas rhizophila TaxID=2071607 RepID=A0A7G9SDZ9_9SPHN|nr:PDZ domain-containing protein [Sphingomonas rhizophila]QNN66074.1 M61 family metallopeptidase [Sphingomonas rhizophila]